MGDAIPQMDFRRGSLPSVVATVVARFTPTVSAVASFSSQRVTRQPSGSRTEEGKREGLWSSQDCWQRFPLTGSTPQRNGTVISCSSETTRSNVSRSSCEAARSKVAKLKHVLATLGEDDDMYPAVQEALSKAEYQARVQPVCERIRSTKSFVERKQKQVEQAKQATERAREALTLAMSSQREEENLLAEGERRLAELTMEEKALLSAFQVTPDCKVNAEFNQLRSVIARLRQQQDVRSVVVEANHIPVERQEWESWMNH